MQPTDLAVPTEWPSGYPADVSGVEEPHRGNWQLEVLDELAKALRQAADNSDSETFYDLVSHVVVGRNVDVNDWRDHGKPLLNFDDVAYLAVTYGGEQRLLDDARRLLTQERQHVLTPLGLKLSRGQLSPEQIAAGQRVREVIAQQQALGQRVVKPLARALSGVAAIEFADALLNAWKEITEEVAGALADANLPNLAATLKTIDDFLVPDNSLEMALDRVPIHKLAGTASVLLATLGRASPSLKVGVGRIRAALSKDLAPPISKLVNRILKRGEKRDLQTLVIVEENMLSILPSHVVTRGARRTVSHPLDAGAVSQLRELLKVPKGAQIGFERRTLKGAGDKSTEYIVQSRRATELKVVEAKRGDLRKVFEEAGLLTMPDQHRAHLLPHILGGEGELFNLVRMNARINQSYASLIDSLRAQDLTGAVLEVEVLFRTQADAVNRHADQIQWKVTWPDRPAFVERLETPLYRPDLTYMEQINAVFKALRRAEKNGVPTAAENLANFPNIVDDLVRAKKE